MVGVREPPRRAESEPRAGAKRRYTMLAIATATSEFCLESGTESGDVRISRVLKMEERTVPWRRVRDSNPRYPSGYAGFQDRCHQPLGQLSAPIVLLQSGIFSGCSACFQFEKSHVGTAAPGCPAERSSALFPGKSGRFALDWTAGGDCPHASLAVTPVLKKRETLLRRRRRSA